MGKPWLILKISKASYYRQLRRGTQRSLIPEFIQWKELGLTENLWSHSYKKNVLLQLEKYFREFPIVTPAGVAYWISQIPIERFSNRKDRHASLSMFAKFLKDRQILNQADYYSIRGMYPKKSRYYRPQQKIITSEQLQTIIESFQDHSVLESAVIVLSETALRLAEYCNLKQEDIIFSDNPTIARLHVRCGKGGKDRWVPFSRKAQAAIQNPWLKPGYRWLMDQFKAQSKNIGIPFSAHSFRHYRITQWANNSRIPITTVQKWAGHECLTVTQQYIHLTDEEALKAAFE